MSNIVRLPVKPNGIISGLETILEMAKRGEITDFQFAAKMPNGEVATSWSADIVTRQELISHMQIDVMMGVVEKNMIG